MKHIFGILVSLASVFLTYQPVAAAPNIQGYVEYAGGPVYGWAVDMNNQTGAVRIDFYLDGTQSAGKFIGSVNANAPRPDLNANGVAGNHGFMFFVSSKYADGKAHSIAAYAVSGPATQLLTGSQQTNVLPCSVYWCPLPPIGSEPGTPITVQSVGQAEVVFDYGADQCTPGDRPDSPARAFRDSDGKVNLIAANMILFRSTGTTLDMVTRNCSPAMYSTNDPTYDKAAYREWVASPYTVNGTDVYGLIHNEWYASLIDSRCTAPYTATAGWLNFITLAASHDKGASFSHPLSYKIISPAVPWSTSFACSNHYGAYEPSNIIAKDGYYYAFFGSEPDPYNISPWGACLMRTNDLSSASAWQVWTSTGYKSPAISQCEPIQSNIIEAMRHSITYNSYLGKYVLVGEKTSPAKGIYFSTSPDLIHWTQAIRIAPVASSNYSLKYPSLLDPLDYSLNFEKTSREPYLYMTIDYGNGNRDLVRQKLSFTIAAISTSDTLAPSVPAGLTAFVSSSQIDLSWTASTDNVGVVGYKVYRNGAQIATTTTTKYSNIGLTPSTSYSYTVAAYDAAGNTSLRSASVSAITQSQQTPTRVIGARIMMIATVDVWSKPATSRSSRVLGTQPQGSYGTITQGPQARTGYTWWYVDFDAGADGWVVVSN